MACTHMSNCELYVQFAADPSIEVWKSHFCAGDFKKCARFQRSLTGAAIPLTLLPNGKEILDNINTVDVGINALFNAIQKDRLPMVRAIMKAKIGSGTIANSAGMTPLMYAAMATTEAPKQPQAQIVGGAGEKKPSLFGKLFSALFGRGEKKAA